MNTTIPISHAMTWARRALVTQRASSTQRTKPRIPPFASTVAMRAPMRKVKTMTRALPASPSTPIAPSIALAAPVTGFQPERIVWPSQMPAARERNT